MKKAYSVELRASCTILADSYEDACETANRIMCLEDLEIDLPYQASPEVRVTETRNQSEDFKRFAVNFGE